MYRIIKTYFVCVCLCVHTRSCCSRDLKPVILLENKSSQPLHEESGIMHITTADSSRWELQAMLKCCKCFFFFSSIFGITLNIHNDVTDFECTVPEKTEISGGKNISSAPSF